MGEFQTNESILVIFENGEFYTTDFDLNNHYENGIAYIEKFDAEKAWTAVLYDADQQNFPYLKRFTFEVTNKRQSYLGENKQNKLVLLSDEVYPRLQVVFGGNDRFREPLIVEASDFVGVKSYKAKGKRLTTYAVEEIKELDPVRVPDSEEKIESEAIGTDDLENEDGQMTLFDEE